MGLSGYPPGVTGSEYAIAGPDFEEESFEPCEHCREWMDGTTIGYRYDRWFVCSTCGKTSGLPDGEPEFDADRYNDDKEDARLARDEREW